MPLKALVTRICQPDPKTVKNSQESEIIFKRNQRILMIEMLFLMVVFISALVGKASNLSMQGFILAILARFITFLCTCRSHQTLFKTLYFLNMTLFGPLALYLDTEFVFGNYIGAYFIPICTLYLNGRKTFFFQIILQIILLQLHCKPSLIEFLDLTTHATYAKRMINVTSCGVILNSAFVLFSQMSLVEAHKQIGIEQNKKVELERQKTFHLSFSHELRNLINTMLGSIQLSLLEHLPEKVRDLLHNSEVCGELLLHLINNILDTGKVEIGELEINATSTPVYDTFEKVWGLCSQLIKGKNLTGQMRINKNLPKMLKIDNYRLIQIMMNLLGNAIKFTEKGSINIDVHWIEDAVYVSEKCFEPMPFDNESEGIFEKGQALSRLDQTVSILDLERRKLRKDQENSKIRWSGCSRGVLKIVVTDTGCGVCSQKLPKLFNKFSQVSDDPSKRKLGTGLGLFITKELIERMHGKIKAFSKEGHGTAFIACFPAEVIQQNEIKSIDKQTFIGLARSRRLRAMVVDDVDFNIDILSKYLTTLGIEVVDSAKNGREALEKFKAHSIAGAPLDIVTMDVEMPVMDGKRATGLIRDYEEEVNLPPCLIMTVSGNCTESEIAQCVENKRAASSTKADIFMKKPVSINDLLKAMKTKFEDGTWDIRVV